MIKNIVFDMGWVLLEYQPIDYIRRWISDETDAELVNSAMFRPKEWLQNDRGTIEPEEYLRFALSHLPKRLHADAAQIWEHWFEYMVPIPETNELARQLKGRGYRVYLLSNVSKKYRQFRGLIPCVPVLDGEFISADVHTIKPEPEIYRLFFDRYGLRPEECFFIDDREENIAAGEAFGMRGFCYRQDINGLKTALNQAGVEI
ncbi:MAG: HAD family phosphatase [Clostridiales bacterium]|jgi:putative hydrolase of the HAD superfamily|nr:HAD family phosphatase [Clostridiales bacterium]